MKVYSLRSKLNEKEVCFDSLGGEGGREGADM